MGDLQPGSAPAPAAANISDPDDSGKGSIVARFSDPHKRKFDQINSLEKLTTYPSSQEWLRSVISPLPLKPSPKLEQFFSSCDTNVASAILHRADIILEAIFGSNKLKLTSLREGIWVEQRKLEALKLYYKVLEAMCIAEAKILNECNLTSLLTNERFHRCMLASSAELILVAHKTMTMQFHVIIERAGITAFDLSKVIEGFIRHEESLPRELRRHLNSLEEQLLESLVWEKGSSMYDSLAVARPALLLEINRLGLLAEPMPSLDEISMDLVVSFETLTGQGRDTLPSKRLQTGYISALVERSTFKSPLKNRLLLYNNLKSNPLSPASQTAVVSPARQNLGKGVETCAETAINIFFNKIGKLAAVRIKGMVERLKLSQEIRGIVFGIFQQILKERTTLFFNRHVDQIILCCLYVVAKMSKLELTFGEIISQYEKQSHCHPQIQNVFVDQSSAGRPGISAQKHVGIMEFYNDIFIISVRPLVKEFGPVDIAHNSNLNSETQNSSNDQCPITPKLSPFPKLPDLSPRKVSAKHNVYVSPLQSAKRYALMSNCSKSYYACIGESTHPFRSPSKDLEAINDRLNGNKKARGMLNFDDLSGAFGLVSHSMVGNTVSLQNGSCCSSSPEPVVKIKEVDV